MDMPTINAAIPASVAAPQTSPLDTIVKAQSLGKGLLETKLLGQQVEGKIAMGEAAQKAVDENGKFDGAEFLKLLSANPKGSFQVPEAAAQAVARQLQDKQLDTATMELMKKRWATIGDVASAILSPRMDPATGKPMPLTRDYVKDTLSRDLIASGQFNEPAAIQQIAAVLTSLPEDEKGLRDRIAQIYLQGHAVTEGVNYLKGAPQAMDTGGSVQVVQPSGLTGEVSSMGGLSKTLPPGEAIKPAYSQFNPKTGQMETVLAGDALAAQQGAPGAPRAIPAGPPLGAEAAATGAAQGAVEQLKAHRAEVERVPIDRAGLLNMRDKLKDFTPGPKANWSYALSSLASMLGVAAPKVVEGAAAQEEFAKLAQQFVQRQVATIGGGGTDSKLEASTKAAPNEFLTREGNTKIIGLMLGLLDATEAKDKAWQKWASAGNGPETYPKFVSEFNRYYNPRVFQAGQMSEKDRQSMLGNMTKPEQAQFENDWKFAKKAGWIK